MFGEFIFSECLAEKVWQMNRLPNRLLIVSTILSDFSLANHGWFAKLSNFLTIQYAISQSTLSLYS